MCFSAPVSFVTSAGLTAAGVTGMKIARHEHRWLATVPFIFAIQQLIEGLQWVVEKPSAASLVLGYAFLFFAFLWWPTYIPIGVYVHEKNKRRRSILKIFIALGVIATAFLLYILFTQPLAVEVFERHIYYRIDVPWTIFGAIYYVFVVAGSFFLSTDKDFNIFGIFVILSAVLAWRIESITFTSVWCFFAAVLSALAVVYLYLRRKS